MRKMITTAEYEYFMEKEQTIISRCDEDEEEHRKVVEEDLRKIN